MKKVLFCLIGGAMMLSAQAQHTFKVQAKKPTADIAPTMYGIFFEDINFGADGGLYAELVENRSFEFPNATMGWEMSGETSIKADNPAFDRNPHYVNMKQPGHAHRRTCIENHGFFGIGLRQGMTYDFAVYARTQGRPATIRVQLMNSTHDPVATDTLAITAGQWNKYTLSLKSDITDAHGFLRIVLTRGEVDLDHISLMPHDNWNGLRADLVQRLADLHPGVFRFPGGCIVEGTTLDTRYEWKKSVGPAENRPLNENRWNFTMEDRQYPNYFQSLGLGFYEYFLLSERIGASPLPILSCGIACQFQNAPGDKSARVELADLQPYIDDALDLIEFANGDASTQWGRLRAEMGHPAPFGLKYIGIGNEQWDEMYPERLEPFLKAIRAKYPNIQVVGSAGPSASGKSFDYGWEQMRRLKADLVDEHYYMSPEWFLQNAGRYDKYPRKGPKVFAGEYAAHGTGQRNNFEAALAEAAFLTGIERNADVVRMATYAPLFSHVEGHQWQPDLIWFDNLNSFCTPNYYVQQLYSHYKGTQVLKLTENGQAVEGSDGLYASAVFDSTTGRYYVKVANAGITDQPINIEFTGNRPVTSGQVITLHAADTAENSLAQPKAIEPRTSSITTKTNGVETTIGARTFAVYVLETN